MDDSQAVIKISGRNINNLRYADDTTLMAESKEEVRSLLIRVKESEKAGLKFNIQNTKIMAYSPIISWQIEGGKVKTVTVLFSWAPKSVQTVTAALKLKKHLLLGRKALTNLESILKSRDITWPTKVPLVKGMFFQ